MPRIEGGRDYFTRLAELFADAAGGLDQSTSRGSSTATSSREPDAHRRRAAAIVVMDLGLAKVADASQSLTRTETGVLGTLRYAPPEQLRRREAKVDRRSDVYGLGATLYELATAADLRRRDRGAGPQAGPRRPARPAPAGRADRAAGPGDDHHGRGRPVP